MSDEQRPHQHDEDDVEAHGPHGHKMGANTEAGDEAAGEDDEVEAHGHGHKIA